MSVTGEIAFFIADHLQPKYRSVAFATLCQHVNADLESLGVDGPPKSPWAQDRPRTPFLRGAGGKFVRLVPDFIEVLQTIEELAQDKSIARKMAPAKAAADRMWQREAELGRQQVL